MKPDEYYMQEAMKEAEISVQKGNSPFSVIVVDPEGKIIWRDHDRQNEKCDPTAPFSWEKQVPVQDLTKPPDYLYTV